MSTTYLRLDVLVQSALGAAISGASVWVCNQPTNTSSLPPSPLATIYSDSSGTAATQPLITNGMGGADCYVAAGTYTVVTNSQQTGTNVLPDQSVGLTGSITVPMLGEVPDGTIDGTNKVFTLSQSPNPASGLILLLNGLGQTLTTSFSVSGNTITFVTAPPVKATLYAVYPY